MVKLGSLFLSLDLYRKIVSMYKCLFIQAQNR